jgi:hypothetical protein
MNMRATLNIPDELLSENIGRRCETQREKDGDGLHDSEEISRALGF